LWDVATAQAIRRIETDVPINSLSISVDGKYILVGSDEVATLWDAASGSVIRTHKDLAGPVALSPTGPFALAGGRDGRLVLFNIETGEMRYTLIKPRKGALLGVCCISFTADGQRAVSASLNGDLQLWDINSGRLLYSYKMEIAIAAVALSPDGKFALLGGNDHPGRRGAITAGNANSLKLFDLNKGEIVREFVGHTYLIRSIAFTPDGRYALSGSEGEPSLILWEISTGKPIRFFESASHIQALAILPDGSSALTVGSNPVLQLWDLRTGALSKAFGKSLEGNSGVLRASVAHGRYLVAAGPRKTIKLWDLRTGFTFKASTNNAGQVATLVGARKLPIIASGSEEEGLKIWKVPELVAVKTLRTNDDYVTSAALSPDGTLAAVGNEDGTLNIWDVTAAKLLNTFKRTNRVRDSGAPESALTNYVSSVAFSANGRFVLTGYQDGRIGIFHASTAKRERFLRGHDRSILCVAVSPDQRFILSGDKEEMILWDFASGREMRRIDRSTGISCPSVFLNDGLHVISAKRSWDVNARKGATLRIWNFKNGAVKVMLGDGGYGESSEISSLEISPDDTFAFSRHQDGAIRIWNLKARALLVTLDTGESANDWLVIDPSGRFDSGALDDGAPFSWVASDDAFRPLPPEIFMRDYFEPRLLPRLLACHEAEMTRPGACEKEFKPVRPLASLNRSQPEVRIVSVVPEAGAADEVAVTVEVRGVERSYGTAGQPKTWQSGAYDLRLFRDGQLVRQAPDVKEPEPLGILEPEADVARWREIYRLVDRVGFKQLTFRHIRLSAREKGSAIEFSAYAFNVDRVKSATARTTYTVPQSLPPRDRRAYVVAVGVSAYEDPAWDLRYADDDARRLVQVLEPRLKATGQYKEVVPILLLADWVERDGVRTVTAATATKQNVKAVLDILAGRDVPEDVRDALPNGARLHRAEPDDLVLIAYSSHGYADRAGNFYLFPYDIGSNTGKVVSAEILKRAISSAELSVWLRDLDAGELIMVVDACHSAASVESPEFKPGPMGARGLGQLAYDKGMRILASTRADDVAWESAQTQQGLLSYALVRDGLEEGKADFRPADGRIGVQEWLEYALQRVPQLYMEAMGSSVQNGATKETLPDSTADSRRKNARLVIFDSATRSSRYITRPGAPAPTQQPAFFNYKRGEDTTLVMGR
jgi:WD40 repeat protein/uncharacterized caspase-like protein